MRREKRRTFGSAQRIRTPTFLQSDRAECGAACLGSVLAYFGRWMPAGELRTLCRVGRDGSTAADLLQAARKVGLSGRGWRRTVTQLRRSALPAILFWEGNHFVVLEGVGLNRYYINDPSSGHRAIGSEEFARAYTGVALEFERTSSFSTIRKPPGAFRHLWQWVCEFRSALAITGVISLLLSLVLLTFPLGLIFFVDQVLLLGQSEWGPALVTVMAASGILVFLLSWMQARALRRLTVGMSVSRSDRFVDHLLSLPSKFFVHRLAGDLVLRAQRINQLSVEGAGRLVRVLFEALTCLAFLSVMAFFDVFLAGIVSSLICAWGVLLFALTRVRRDLSQVFKREQGLLSGLAFGGMQSLPAIRATAGEAGFFARWGGYLANELRARQPLEELGHVVNALPLLFNFIGNALILGVGGWRVANGDLTAGILVGSFVLANSVFYPMGRVLTFAAELPSRAEELARLDDVMTTGVPVRKPVSSNTPVIQTVGGKLRLSGRVEFRNVTFGFQEAKPPLFEGFSLTIDPGERVAIVGPSGSGKTALALLFTGFHEPWSGEILYDGHSLRDVPPEVFAESLSMVDQQPMLFAGSVRDNLTFWNPAVPDERIVAASRDAGIHEVVVSRPGGYDSPVLEGGSNFSSGQLQRLEIARALVSNPSILILDEPTSALDAVSEVEIDRSLRRRGCTCVIVAHRLSTIRDSDLIVVLENGKEVQRGRHEDLVAVDGLYRRLVDA